MVLNKKYLQVDETPMKILDRDHNPDSHPGGIHQGFMLLYHALVDRLDLFDYRRGRDQSGPKAMLAEFKGIIQTDGYKVYDDLFENHPDIHLIFCMVRARRYFVKAVKNDEKQVNYGLDQIQKFYLLEQQIKEENLKWEQRIAARKKHADPILESLGKWLGGNQYSYRPESPMGKVIAYAHKRCTGLSAYVLHGQMEIDNNLVENAVRPLAIGRKNYLFVRSHNAADMTAAMYSFMGRCKKNNLNEFD
jgi:hypothetical protein